MAAAGSSMAPEPVRADGVHARSDFWARGIVQYETVVAKRLFSAGISHEIFATRRSRIIHAAVAWLDEFPVRVQ